MWLGTCMGSMESVVTLMFIYKGLEPRVSGYSRIASASNPQDLSPSAASSSLFSFLS